MMGRYELGRPKQVLQVGDRVCYSRTFLRSTGQYSGETPQARGVVEQFIPLGEIILAEIAWGVANVPKRVNVANLTRVTAHGIIKVHGTLNPFNVPVGFGNSVVFKNVGQPR